MSKMSTEDKRIAFMAVGIVVTFVVFFAALLLRRDPRPVGGG